MSRSLRYAIDYRRGPVEDRMSGDEYPPVQGVRTHVISIGDLSCRLGELERRFNDLEAQVVRLSGLLASAKPTPPDMVWAEGRIKRIDGADSVASMDGKRRDTALGPNAGRRRRNPRIPT